MFTKGPQGIPFDDMVTHQLAWSRMVTQQPYVEAFMSTAAGGNVGHILIRLKPKNQRGSIQALVQDLRARVAQIPVYYILSGAVPGVGTVG